MTGVEARDTFWQGPFWGWPDEVWDTTRKAARAVARQWGCVDPEDVVQDAFLYVGEHPKVVASRLDNMGGLYRHVFNRMWRKVRGEAQKASRNVSIEDLEGISG